MQVSVNESGCIGCGLCESICPEVFYMEDNISKVKDDVDYKECSHEILAAKEACPVSVIQVES